MKFQRPFASISPMMAETIPKSMQQELQSDWVETRLLSLRLFFHFSPGSSRSFLTEIERRWEGVEQRN